MKPVTAKAVLGQANRYYTSVLVSLRGFKLTMIPSSGPQENCYGVSLGGTEKKQEGVGVGWQGVDQASAPLQMEFRFLAVQEQRNHRCKQICFVLQGYFGSSAEVVGPTRGGVPHKGMGERDGASWEVFRSLEASPFEKINAGLFWVFLLEEGDIKEPTRVPQPLLLSQPLM